MTIFPSDNLKNGKFHQHLRDTFAPQVVRYVDLMESSIAQSIHKVSTTKRTIWNNSSPFDNSSSLRCHLKRSFKIWVKVFNPQGFEKERWEIKGWVPSSPSTKSHEKKSNQIIYPKIITIHQISWNEIQPNDPTKNNHHAPSIIKYNFESFADQG